jgi:hypothetical protein
MATLSPIIAMFLMCLLTFLQGCVSIGPPDHQRQEIVYEDGKVQKFAYLGDTYGSNRGTVANDFLEVVSTMNRVDPSVLPNLEDLPAIKSTKAKNKIKKYTGLVQNLTKFDISIPSGNSDATIIVPAHGWREYVTWTPNVQLFGFVDGKQIYYQSLRAQPEKFQYMGNKYDFVAEIQAPPEPAPEVKPYCPPKRKPKKRPKKRICPA